MPLKDGWGISVGAVEDDPWTVTGTTAEIMVDRRGEEINKGDAYRHSNNPFFLQGIVSSPCKGINHLD